MSAVVVDTHSVLWYLGADPKLSYRARRSMESAADLGQPIFIPTICLVEATYLIEKKRIQEIAFTTLADVLRLPGSPFQTAPLTAEIAFVLRDISRSSVPDLPDRVIAATALALGLPLITRDGKIRAAGIETIW